MYAEPMILSLLEMNSKWVASTPGVLKGGYGEQLISVSDKSEADVVRACMQTLHSGQSLIVLIDGAQIQRAVYRLFRPADYLLHLLLSSSQENALTHCIWCSSVARRTHPFCFGENGRSAEI